MPYFWGPHYFARAMGSSRYATADRTFYGPPDELRRRNYEFSETFFKRDRSILRTHIRDLFEFNLLCRSHLDYRIDGVPTLTVQGRYATSPGLAGGFDQATGVVDYLVQRSRGKA